MANDVPDDAAPSSASDADPGSKPKVSATARNAARRNHKGKKRQGRNNRGTLANETRIEMVVRLLDSLEEPPYVQRVVAKAFRCSERTVRDDIARVQAERAAEREPDAYEERLTYKRLLLTQVRVCLREGNKSEARRFLDMLIRIGGHYAPDALKVFEMNYGSLERLSEEQLDQMEREMWAKFGPPTGRILPPGPPASPPPASTPSQAAVPAPAESPASEPPAGSQNAGPRPETGAPIDVTFTEVQGSAPTGTDAEAGAATAPPQEGHERAEGQEEEAGDVAAGDVAAAADAGEADPDRRG